MLSIIVAVANNNVIGKDNKLIWHLPEDLKRFKALTTGHTIIMGRKTFESLGRVLPNRKHIVLCNDVNLNIENENVETMDFEEIYQTFKKQAQAQFTESAFLDLDATETGKIQIEISEITEGLFRIKEKSNTEDFLMIPAWSFSGTLRVDGEDWGKQQFLMINGIDGSVINTSLGY